MLKIAEKSIKQNTNHVMIVQKENKKRKRWTPPKGKVKGKFPMSPQALSKSQRSNLDLLLMMNASIAMPRDTGQGTARNTWKTRKRREVRLPLQVFILQKLILLYLLVIHGYLIPVQ
jgi:hypothetical protein